MVPLTSEHQAHGTKKLAESAESDNRSKNITWRKHQQAVGQNPFIVRLLSEVSARKTEIAHNPADSVREKDKCITDKDISDVVLRILTVPYNRQSDIMQIVAPSKNA